MVEEKTGINWIWVAASLFAIAVVTIGGLRYRSAPPTPGVTVVAAPAQNAVETASPVADPSAQMPPIPAFDTVRIDPDGSALVAGQGPAGATLRVMVDGAEAATGVVDAAGKFAALFDLPSSDAPRLLTLEAVMPDGTVTASSDSVAVAPTTAPMVPDATVAAAETAPADGDVAGTAMPVAPATLLVTEDGVSVLQSPATPTEPGQPVTVGIDAISYAPDGAVQLSGQATPGGIVRLYLDNSELMTLTAPDNGRWSATLPDVAPGIYMLRADQIGANGAVVSRFETPFKRETPQELAAATAPVAMAEPAPTETAKPPTASATAVTAPDEGVANPAATAQDPAAIPDPDAPVAVASAEPAAGTAIAPAPPVTMTVQPGFSLWKIARESYGDGVMYVQVFDANRDKIKNPNLIYPGQVFTMPAIP